MAEPRDRNLLLSLAALSVLAAFVVSRFVPRERTGGFEQPSTFFTAADGAKAAYLVLERLGRPVARLRRSIRKETLADVRTLFVLAPTTRLDRLEARALLDWVNDGHVLVLAAGPVETFGELVETSSLAGHTGGPGEAALDRAEPLLAGIRTLDAGPRVRQTLVGAAYGAVTTTGVSRFWRDSRGTLGLRIDHGRGTIFVFSTAYPFTNEGLGKADDALLLDALARTGSGPGRVAFDEFHQGFGESDASPVAMAKLALSPRFRAAMVDLFLVLGAAAALGFVRFGSPIPRAEPRRRRHADFARAAGDLFRAARGSPNFLVARRLGELRDWTRRTFRLPKTTPDGAVDQTLDDAGAATARRALAALAASSRLEPADVLRASLLSHDVKERVSHGIR
ncbi:MAG TPA: DUF4350 domain-containing protein [Polyangiaceae bacterium]|nr:DUF4350 domain-containing protein [Polyangiaceae bacterium]